MIRMVVILLALATTTSADTLLTFDAADNKPEVLKRRLVAEVGDNIRLSGWDDECVFRILHKTDDPSIRDSIYQVPDGLEWEIHLAKRPPSCTLVYPVEHHGLRFLYQDSTPTRIDSVIGSYALYHKSGRHNNQYKHYGTGKFGHIWRPKAWDSNADTVWCEMHIDTVDNFFRLTMPPDFWRDATYPVLIDPKFGDTTAGATADVAMGSFNIWANWTDSLMLSGTAGTLDTAYWHGREGHSMCGGYGGGSLCSELKVYVYTKGGNCAACNYMDSTDGRICVDGVGTAWYKMAMGGLSLDADSTYTIAFQGHGDISAADYEICIQCSYDSDKAADSKGVTDTDMTPPSDLTGCSSKQGILSMYMVYTIPEEDVGPPNERHSPDGPGQLHGPDGASTLSNP